MDFKVILLTSTSVTLELTNTEIVETKSFYNLYVNEQLVYAQERRNVISLYQLQPDTDYEITIISKTGESGSLKIKTDAESICLFRETDRGLRIKTRRGRGQDGRVENIHFAYIRMEKVLTPLVINCYYFCDPDGHSDYVRSKEALPVDEKTPYLGGFAFEQITCRECEVAGAFFYGLPEQPIESISLRHCFFHFSENAKAGYPAMMDDIPKYCKAGFIFNNVKKIELEDVIIVGNEGERIVGNYDFTKNNC